ncbi:hypothetical protein N9Z53_02420 [Mariniblastus sp.]|nr:hypothetical protein [bacterium]MDA7880484.1 hypothetical protein [Mariniblastus sp.]MDA7904085.1 hypothetical protein [bacterium]MDA7924164.1 hypothetical protein [Mariniblastus sp.]MDB4372610.1 hypothetical protein [Mariniblastus sp.]
MGRRQESGDNDVSLFPFLSILACIIGVLTLMISTLALSQMDTEAVVAAEAYEKLEADLARSEMEISDLTKQIQAEAGKNEAAKKQRELLQLKRENTATQELFLVAQEEESQLKAKLDPAATELKQEPLEVLTADLNGYLEQIAQFKKELANRGLPPEEGEFSVLPGGSGVGVVPRFIECTSNELVLHHLAQPIRVRVNAIETNKELLKLLNEVAGTAGGKVIFLVRDDGVSVYRRAKRFADSLGVENGKLPVLGQGRINLQFFRGK